MITTCPFDSLLVRCALLLCALSGCGDDADGASSGSDDAAGSSTSDGDVDPADLAACPETDLNATPFMGAAFDANGELLEPLPVPHIVATTVGWAKLDPADEQAVNEASNRVITEQFVTADGVLGGTFALSEACGSARTMTIWRDEDALRAFVFSGVHVEVMGTHLVHTRAWETTHWTESTDAGAPTWERARSQLDAARD